MSSFDDLNKSFPTLNLGNMDSTKYEPGGKVTATKPECVELANSINTNIDNFNRAKNDLINKLIELNELQDKFEEQVNRGKGALPVYLDAVKHMDALTEACKRVQKCDSKEVRQNMQTYRAQANVAMSTISFAIEFINSSIDKANKIADAMRDAFGRCVNFGLEVTQNLKPKFEVCEAGDGTVVVSITQPSGTSGSGSGSTDTGGSSTGGSTEVAQQSSQNSDSSGVSGALA
jgi:hypothetical protein